MPLGATRRAGAAVFTWGTEITEGPVQSFLGDDRRGIENVRTNRRTGVGGRLEEEELCTSFSEVSLSWYGGSAVSWPGRNLHRGFHPHKSGIFGGVADPRTPLKRREHAHSFPLGGEALSRSTRKADASCSTWTMLSCGTGTKTTVSSRLASTLLTTSKRVTAIASGTSSQSVPAHNA